MVGGCHTYLGGSAVHAHEVIIIPSSNVLAMVTPRLGAGLLVLRLAVSWRVSPSFSLPSKSFASCHTICVHRMNSLWQTLKHKAKQQQKDEEKKIKIQISIKERFTVIIKLQFIYSVIHPCIARVRCREKTKSAPHHSKKNTSPSPPTTITRLPKLLPRTRWYQHL